MARVLRNNMAWHLLCQMLEHQMLLHNHKHRFGNSFELHFLRPTNMNHISDMFVREHPEHLFVNESDGLKRYLRLQRVNMRLNQTFVNQLPEYSMFKFSVHCQSSKFVNHQNFNELGLDHVLESWKIA